MRSIDVSYGYHEELGPGPFPHDAAPLLRDRYFENLANERLTALELNLRRLEQAQDQAESILRLLRTERERWS